MSRRCKKGGEEWRKWSEDGRNEKKRKDIEDKKGREKKCEEIQKKKLGSCQVVKSSCTVGPQLKTIITFQSCLFFGAGPLKLLPVTLTKFVPKFV